VRLYEADKVHTVYISDNFVNEFVD